MIDQLTSKIYVISLFQACVLGGKLCGTDHRHSQAQLFIHIREKNLCFFHEQEFIFVICWNIY
jgi:hypothetical protein